MGPGTAGSDSELIDGLTLGFSSELWGLDIIERPTTVAGVTLLEGFVVASLNLDGDIVGTVGQPQATVDSEDFFYLDVVTAGASPVAGAYALFDGSDVALNTSNEEVVGLSMAAPANTLTATLAVNSTGDASDISLGDGQCDTGGTNSQGSQECTLRAAIAEANALAGSDLITFDIPTTEAGYSAAPLSYTIQPTAALPIITGAVIVDGTTQPDYPGTPHIVVDGSGAGVVDGLSLAASNSEIRGLVVMNFGDDGIQVDGNSNIIAGNYVGLDVTGSNAAGNDDGILVFGTGNTIAASHLGSTLRSFLDALEGTSKLSPSQRHSPDALLPAECRNFHYLSVRPDDGGELWVVFFEYSRRRPYVVGIGRDI